MKKLLCGQILFSVFFASANVGHAILLPYNSSDILETNPFSGLFRYETSGDPLVHDTSFSFSWGGDTWSGSAPIQAIPSENRVRITFITGLPGSNILMETNVFFSRTAQLSAELPTVLSGTVQVAQPPWGNLISGIVNYVIVVPEPKTMLLFGTGLLSLAGVRLRKKLKK